MYSDVCKYGQSSFIPHETPRKRSPGAGFRKNWAVNKGGMNQVSHPDILGCASSHLDHELPSGVCQDQVGQDLEGKWTTRHREKEAVKLRE